MKVVCKVFHKGKRGKNFDFDPKIFGIIYKVSANREKREVNKRGEKSCLEKLQH